MDLQLKKVYNPLAQLIEVPVDSFYKINKNSIDLWWRHSLVDLSPPSILLPWVRVPAHHLRFHQYIKLCNVEKTKINKRGRDWPIFLKLQIPDLADYDQDGHFVQCSLQTQKCFRMKSRKMQNQKKEKAVKCERQIIIYLKLLMYFLPYTRGDWNRILKQKITLNRSYTLGRGGLKIELKVLLY